MNLEIKRELSDMKTMIEEIHAAIIAGEVIINRGPGRLAIKLAARKMLKDNNKLKLVLNSEKRASL